VLPGLVGVALIAVLDAVVEMEIRRGAQAFVIEAGQAEAFLQIFFERMERFELRGEGGRGPATGTFPEHLKATIHQQTDFIAEHEARFIDVRVLSGAIFNDRADAITQDLGLAGAGGTGAEAKLAQTIQALGEGRFVNFFSAKEHALTIMPECGFLRR
jgi:hypothetical protein